jgi:hypothetical protein
MTLEDLRPLQNSRRAPLFALSAAFLYLLWLSWLKWGDLIIDSGREMMVPARLAGGEVLYRDVFYLYGPLPPYVHAALFKLFGTNLWVLIASGIVIAALSTALIYKVSRIFLDRTFSTLSAAAFLFVLAFGHYVYLANYNFILPYSYAATFAVSSSLAAVLLLFRFFRTERPREAFAAAATTSFCLLSKPEVGVFLLIAVFGTLLIAKASIRKDFRVANVLLILVGMPILLAGMIYGGFAAVSSGRILGSNLNDLVAVNTDLKAPFTSGLSGTDNAAGNLWLMARSLWGYVLLAGIFFCAGWLLTILRTITNNILRRTLYAIAATVAIAAAFVSLVSASDPQLQYRPLPLILIGTGVAFALRLRTTSKAESLTGLLLSIFALLMTLRMLLNLHPAHYGFYLLTPGLILYHAALLDLVPSLSRTTVIRRTVSAGFALALVFLGFAHFRTSFSFYTQKTVEVSSPRGSIRVLPSPETTRIAELIDYLRRNTPDNATVGVFPEGLTINFLSQRDSPLYYYTFLPQDLARPSVEDDVVAEMQSKRLDYVALVQRPLEEYGRHFFGVDYGRKIGVYIGRNYSLEKVFGPFPYTTDDFGIALFKRKTPPSTP